MSGSSSAAARGDSTARRDQGLAVVLAALGSVTREFNARGNYPFKNRSLGRSQLDILFVLSEAAEAAAVTAAATTAVKAAAVTEAATAATAAATTATADAAANADTTTATEAAGVGVGGLAAALGVTSGAITQLVDTLRAGGWVTSEVNPADRRARIIRLTDAAAHELEAFRRDYRSSLAPRFDSLSVVEITELGRLLRKVRAAAPEGSPRRDI